MTWRRQPPRARASSPQRIRPASGFRIIRKPQGLCERRGRQDRAPFGMRRDRAVCLVVLYLESWVE